jgi:hypothetical protein
LPNESRARRRVILKLRAELGQLRPAELPKNSGCYQDRYQQHDCMAPNGANSGDTRVMLMFFHSPNFLTNNPDP